MSTAVSAPAMGLVMKASGELEMREFSTLKEKQAAVGGYIQTVYHPSNGEFVGLCNEDGLADNLALNQRASFLFRQPLVGDVVVFGDEPDCEDFMNVPIYVIMLVLSEREISRWAHDAEADGDTPELVSLLRNVAGNLDIIDRLWKDGWHSDLASLLDAAVRLSGEAR